MSCIQVLERTANKYWAILLAVAGLVAFGLQGIAGLMAAAVIAVFCLCTKAAIDYLRTGRWNRQRRRLFEGLAEPEFLAWQQKTVEALYPDGKFVELLGRRYPAVLLPRSVELHYPFVGLCVLKDETVPCEHLDRGQERYLRILGDTLRAPRMKGFALSKIMFDSSGGTDVFEVRAIRQLHSLVTCHILESEMLELYRKKRSQGVTATTGDFAGLPYRRKYHGEKKGVSAIAEPSDAYPLLSVQGLVLFYDDRRKECPGWRVVLARRSDRVLVKPGFLQFQPSGGFEVYGSQKDESVSLLKQGFDVADALLREYAEELFDAEDLQENKEGRDPNAIRSHKFVSPLLEAVDKGTATIEYLGTIVDLTILRHELSFLIMIRDSFFCRSALIGSWEARNISSPLVGDLPSALREGQLHGSSAGLLQLTLEISRGREVLSTVAADLLTGN